MHPFLAEIAILLGEFDELVTTLFKKVRHHRCNNRFLLLSEDKGDLTIDPTLSFIPKIFNYFG